MVSVGKIPCPLPKCPKADDTGKLGILPQDFSWLLYPNHYKVLSILKNASEKDIKSAYIHKTEKWHPDCSTHLGVDREILEKATRIFTSSHDVLSDRRQRLQYDSGLNPVDCDLGCALSSGDSGERSSPVATITRGLKAKVLNLVRRRVWPLELHG